MNDGWLGETVVGWPMCLCLGGKTVGDEGEGGEAGEADGRVPVMCSWSAVGWARRQDAEACDACVTLTEQSWQSIAPQANR